MWAIVCTTEEEGVPRRVLITHKKQGGKQPSSVSPFAHPLHTIVVVAASH